MILDGVPDKYNSVEFLISEAKNIENFNEAFLSEVKYAIGVCDQCDLLKSRKKILEILIKILNIINKYSETIDNIAEILNGFVAAYEQICSNDSFNP